MAFHQTMDSAESTPFAELLRRRKMVRSFVDAPIDPPVLERVVRAGLRGPSAGNSQGTDLVVLTADAVARYWSVTLPAERRADFPWPGLLLAPALVLVVADPGAYRSRYAEPDKASTGLGGPDAEWAVPFWYVDAGAAIMAILLAAADAGLGALLFGTFDHEPAVRDAFGIPADRSIAGVVALGHPGADRDSKSAARPRRSPDDAVHDNGW